MPDEFDPAFQSDWFRGHEDAVLAMHETNIAARLLVREPIAELVSQELAASGMGSGFGDILEVGCGSGFFTRYAAPAWLRPRIVSIDISEASLAVARQHDPLGRYLQMDANDVQFADGAFGGVIGYSSFDSLPKLAGPLAHVIRVTHEGDPVVFFQDVAVDLYSSHGLATPRQSVERYHQELVRSCRQAGIDIVFEGIVERVNLLPRDEFIARADPARFPQYDPAEVLVALLDCGFYACADDGLLENFSNIFGITQNLDAIVSVDHVVQIVRMRVVRGVS